MMMRSTQIISKNILKPLAAPAKKTMHFELMFHLVLDSQACHLKLQEEERKMHFAMVGTIGLFASMPGAQSPVCLSTLKFWKKKKTFEVTTSCKKPLQKHGHHCQHYHLWCFQFCIAGEPSSKSSGHLFFLGGAGYGTMLVYQHRCPYISFTLSGKKHHGSSMC